MEGDRAVVDWRESVSLKTDTFESVVVSLLSQTNLEGSFKLHPLSGGANNRIFRIEVGHKNVLLKIYFQHSDDVRDRLGAEFSFSRFAWENGIRSLPKPLACDHKNGLGLYDFVEGRSLTSNDVTENLIKQALHFYHELNQHKTSNSARILPKASEACFTTGEHLKCVERRLHHLQRINSESVIDREALSFITNELSQAWSRVLSFVQKQSSKLKLSLDQEVIGQDKCISPSDFGFHNALLSQNGNLYFIDFEYAGWDDPAKMVCDFFSQPSIPVSFNYFDTFSESVVSKMTEPKLHLNRIRLLLPVYQIKWCCILLNDFVAVGDARRKFASNTEDEEDRKKKQLEKARKMLGSVILSKAKDLQDRSFPHALGGNPQTWIPDKNIRG